MNQMKFSNETLTILKNFSEINEGIHFKKGNVLATFHPNKYVLAEASIGETLPKDFALTKLNKFLSVTTLFGEPELDFKNDRILVSKDNRSVNYVYAHPDMVLDPGDRPDKYRKQTLQGKIASANISQSDMKAIKQAAAMLGLPDIQLKGSKNKLTLIATDTSDNSSSNFNIELDAEVDTDFEAVLSVEHLKVIDGDYELVCHPKLAYFKMKELPVEYWIAFRQDNS